MSLKKNNEEIKIEFPNNSLIAILVGNHSVNIIKLEKLINVNINLFGNQFHISGKMEKINLAKLILANVYNKLSNKKIDNTNFEFSDFVTEFRMLSGKINLNSTLSPKLDKIIDYKFETWKKTIIPKSLGQESYFKALNNYELVFGLGPAGTGKSYLAVAKVIDL